MIAKLLLSIIIDLQFLVQSQVSRTYRFVNSVHTLIEGARGKAIMPLSGYLRYYND